MIINKLALENNDWTRPQFKLQITKFYHTLITQVVWRQKHLGWSIGVKMITGERQLASNVLFALLWFSRRNSVITR